MTLLIKSSFKSIDATSKLADRIGITTEALAGLQHGASIYGVEQESLNKSLEQFVRRLGEAQSMGGETKDALDRLGLSAADLASVPVDVAFAKVADTIANLENQTIKADAAYRLFGRQGVKLMNFLQAGKRGVQEMAVEAERLGITFNRLAGLGVEKANDAITRLKATTRGVANQLAIGLAPVVEELADRFRNVGLAGKDMAIAIIEAMERAGLAVAVLAKTLTVIPLAIASIRQQGATATEKSAGRLAKLLGAASAVLPKGFLRSGTESAGRAAESFAGGAGTLAAGLTKEIADRNKELDSTFSALVKEFAKMKDAIKASSLPSRLAGAGSNISVTDVADITAKLLGSTSRDRFAGSKQVSSRRDVIPGGAGTPQKVQKVADSATVQAIKDMHAEMKRIWNNPFAGIPVPAGP